MSLINDALKKAQKQRTGEAPTLASMPSVGGESAQRIARRAKPAGFNTLLLRAGIGAGVVLALALGGWLALKQKPETGDRRPEGSQSASTETAAVGSPPRDELGALSQSKRPAGGPSPATQQPTTSNQSSASSPPFTLPVAPKSEPAIAKAEPPPTTVAKTEPAKPASSTGSNPQVSGLRSQVSAPAAAPAAALPPKLEPRAIQFIENIKVAGIRASATDSKVLMNDRVYRLGDTVEHEMGLKLTGITSSSLTFEDERGGRYTRTF